MSLLRVKSAHKDLVASALDGPLVEEDALAWMVLLHTHVIRLRAEAVEAKWRGDQEAGTVILEPDTQRGVAAVVAKLWKQTHPGAPRLPKADRANYVYWYWEFNTKVPYECWEDVPEELKPKLIELRDRLARNPHVVAVIPD
jgi:hypothetical protein